MAEKKEPKQGIKIVCHGQYYFKTETAKGAKAFETAVYAKSLEMFREHSRRYEGTEEDPVTHLQKAKYKESSFVNVRGQLKRRLLPVILSGKIENFVRIRFVVIDEIISLDGAELDLPIQLRSKKQLAMQIRRENIPINVDDYVDIDELRTDVLEYCTDPDLFLRDKNRKAKKREEEREFRKLNGLEEDALPPTPRKPVSEGIDSL